MKNIQSGFPAEGWPLAATHDWHVFSANKLSLLRRMKTMNKKIAGAFIVCLFAMQACQEKKSDIVASIPFELSGNFIILQVECNGTLKGQFIFDTGLGRISLDSTFASKAGIIPWGDIETSCVNGNRDLPVGKCNIQIGEQNFISDTSLLISTKRFTEKAGCKVDGLIGLDLFGENPIRIDFQKRLIEVFQPGFLPDTSGFQKIQLLDGWMLFTAEIFFQNKTSRRGSFIFDTGANKSVTLFPITDDPILIESMLGKLDTITVRGLCGVDELRYKGIAKALTIGNDTLMDIPTMISLKESDGVPRRFSGLIGMEILLKFDIIIDFPISKLYLKRNGLTQTEISNISLNAN
ncbi:MAG: aspartyl protease family protein [Bacteroidetes bacterium]|nr:aspartyl protease family protein [Bacteroidota bacterium]